MDDARLAQLVAPFYLRLMRLNALEGDDSLLNDVAEAARSATTDEVLALLRGAWRERLMGAWFALLHDEDDIGEAVLDSLASSAGSLTSPPLAVVAVTFVGTRARKALEHYGREDVSHGWGASGFVAAALEHLGSAPTHEQPTDHDRGDRCPLGGRRKGPESSYAVPVSLLRARRFRRGTGFRRDLSCVFLAGRHRAAAMA